MKATSIESCLPHVENGGSASSSELDSRSSSLGQNGGTRLRDLTTAATERHQSEALAHRAVLVVEDSRLYHELLDASRRKDEFLAMLAHELRNPLVPIRNAMEIFRLKSAADPEIHEVAEMVERQIQQLTRLVDDLLDVSRVGHGKINLQMKPVDLKAVVALAIEVSRPLIDARKHVLKVSFPRQAVEVEGDLGRLAQVVSNLLNNSAKYSEDGGRIELSVEAIGDQAVLCVRDAGIGIEPAMLPRIFDLFTQAKGSASRFADGLGIGLALVRNMIELHGGCVQATSLGLGCGTEFVIRLPLLRKTPSLYPAAQHRPWSAVIAPTRRILLIDDNRDAADSMAILLRLAGHDVRTAYDGQTALALARVQFPEVVICDISMPGMCGLELARHLRQDLGLRDCLLVALSGYAQEEDRHRSQEAGFNAHFAKPVSLDSLKALLASEDFLIVGSLVAYKTPISAPGVYFQPEYL
jgi:two-component system, chemotaxis family, CheB/CheR fusion protein